MVQTKKFKMNFLLHLIKKYSILVIKIGELLNMFKLTNGKFKEYGFSNKAFTLIELLAVIIILAIVALIAAPIILDVVDDARKSAGLSEANMIYTSINNYCASIEMKKQMGTLGSEDVDCSSKTSFTDDELQKMVNLGNATVESNAFSEGKLTSLKVISNNHTYVLCSTGAMALEGECDTNPPIENPEYTDKSGANKPELLDNFVPIKYDGANWIVADTKEEWYDYNNKEWANAVVLNDDVTKNVGDTVVEDDIALWYVWIPRYKYQLFNANNGSVNEQEIQITFESGTATTGTVKCTDEVSGSGDSSETCTNAENGNWYTHPAFTFGDQELTGFWVGKFEISGNTSEITIKPNVSSLRSQTVSSFFTAIQNISTSYSLNGDSHMMKNMEWGAVAYLSHSKYGINKEVGINNNSNYTTGCGAAAGSSSSSSCNAYNTTTGMLASTTGNIYGIYDMSGGAYEYVMGNTVNIIGDFYSSSAGFSEAPGLQYYDSYTYGMPDTTHSRGKLGDATKETLKTFGDDWGGWYIDFAYFPISSHSWFERGGYYDYGSYAGLFAFGRSVGAEYSDYSARAVACVRG